MVWEQFKNWLIENIKGITSIIGIIVVVLIIAAGISEYMKYREKNAVEALYTARSQVEALSPEKKASEGVQILEGMAKNFSRSRAAYEAIILMGDIYADAKNYAEALKYYQRAAEGAPDEFAKVMAMYNKATAEELAGNCPQAIHTYADIQKLKSAKFLLPEALLAQGRCLETLKEYARASEVYQKIQNEYPNNSYYSSAASVFLGKIKPLMKN